MAEFPAIPLWTDAYLGDTRHLTTLQHGAYLLLLMTAWRTKECALPDDDNLLARYAGLEIRNWLKIKEVVMEFWMLEDGMWRQGRLTDERESAVVRKHQASNAGKASALKRQGRHSTDVQQSVNSTSTLPNHNHNHNHTKESKESPPTPSTPEPKLFDDQLKTEFLEFYTIFPRHEGKKHAEKAYNTARKAGTSHETIIAGTRKYGAFVAGKNPKFTKHPATWLNGGCWSDDYPAESQATDGKRTYGDSITGSARVAGDILRNKNRYLEQFTDDSESPDMPELKG